MIVYSVLVERYETNESWLEGPWESSWQAEAHAKENNTDCHRKVIKWQMLNAEEIERFRPEVEE